MANMNTIARAILESSGGGGSSELGTSGNSLYSLTEGLPLPYLLVMPDKTTVLTSAGLAKGGPTMVNDSLYVALLSGLRLAVYDDDTEQTVEQVATSGTLTYDDTTYNLYKMVPFDESHPTYGALVYEYMG